MKAKEIIKIIENICPERLAYSWDNVGLLCGDENKDVKKVFVTLDTNINTVKEAISKNADMIVSHHPILLGGIKRIDYSTSVGQMLKLLIENNIPLFAAHTNMDTAKGGINDKLAEIFELTDVKILDQHTDDSSAGLGRYGRLEKTINIVKRYSAHLFCVFPAILKRILIQLQLHRAAAVKLFRLHLKKVRTLL